MALLGLIGGPLAFVGGTLVLFGALKPGGAALFLMTAPEIAWEASLGIYLIVKGFRPCSSLLIDIGPIPVESTPVPLA